MHKLVVIKKIYKYIPQYIYIKLRKTSKIYIDYVIIKTKKLKIIYDQRKYLICHIRIQR